MKPHLSYSNTFQASRNYYFTLYALIFLFSLRVLGQWIQTYNPVTWLPLLEQWQGSNIPYWLLLSVQLLIISLMVYLTYSYHHGKVAANRTKGHVLLCIGLIYFSTMLIRLLVGIFNLTNLSWFDKLIPAFFHLVLAGYIMLLASYHLQYTFIGNTNHAGD